jgi:hypothetical protein
MVAPLRSEREFSLASDKRRTAVSCEQLPDKTAHFRAEVPGRVPGSKAIHDKYVTPAGETREAFKMTIDPAGRVVHVKNKLW